MKVKDGKLLEALARVLGAAELLVLNAKREGAVRTADLLSLEQIVNEAKQELLKELQSSPGGVVEL